MFKELHEIQHKYGYLPLHQLRELAERMKIPTSQLHAVASFYPHFRLAPPPRVDIRVCCDMTCHIRGAPEMKRALQDSFHNFSSEVSIRDVSCLGRCDSAPAIVLNDAIYSDSSIPKAVGMVNDVLGGRNVPPEARDRTPVKAKCDPYQGQSTYSVFKGLVQSKDYAGVIATLKASGLRGMGGAGFPTGLKWEIVRNAKGDDKYIVCNADESEPGTIKDRHIMKHLPYLLVEGMMLAGLVTGAKKGIVYIRHEYEEAADIMREEIHRCYAQGLLGKKILNTDLHYDMEVFISPGGYICGEESALLEAIEGHRSEPRNKPPFPGTHGLFNKPTAINNVETFVFATIILSKGVEWFKAQGRDGSDGMKFVGISGDVARPGVYEVPMGTKYSEILNDYAGGMAGGKRLLGYAPSGPSSGYLPAKMIDLPLDWNKVAAVGSMVGSGAIVICDETRCMLDMALNSIRFFRNESCGKCVPCRMGSQKMVDLLTGWVNGTAKDGDMKQLDELSNAMKMSSICGLGQIAPLPITSVLQNFPEDVKDHLENRRCRAGVCFHTPRDRV